MASIGDTTRPEYIYDQATDTWIPVGIGPHSHTPSAVNSVSLDGGSTITVASGTTVPLTIQNNGTGNSFVVNDVASDTTPFTIDATGNVGIGGVPSATVAGRTYVGIKGTGTTASTGLGVLQLITGAAGSTTPNIGSVEWRVPDNTSAADTRVGYVNMAASGTTANNIGAKMSFATKTNAGGEVVAMTIDDTGKIGIGTTTPTAALDVNGSIKSDNLPGKNFQINGGLDIWQRGTTFASPSNVYTADRWAATPSAGGTTWSVSQVASFLTGSRYALRVQRAAGQTGTPALFLGSALETNDVIRLQGQVVTWSFYVKAGATFSGGTIGAQLNTGTGTDQGPFVVLTGEVSQINTGFTPSSSTAVRQQYTFTVPANATGLRWNLSTQTAGTAGATDYYDITNMQIEIGSVATPFTRAAGPTIQGELMACQRYYYRIGGDAAYTYFVQGQADSTTTAKGTFYFPVTMRTLPSAFEVSANSTFYYFIGAGSVVTPSSVNWGSTGSSRNTSQITIGGTFTSKDPVTLTGAATTNAYLGWSAEL